FSFWCFFPASRPIEKLSRLIFGDSRIPFFSWKHVQMKVWHGLSRNSFFIPSIIKAFCSKNFLKCFFQFKLQIKNRFFLFAREFIKNRNTTNWNNKNVSGNNRNVRGECPGK